MSSIVPSSAISFHIIVDFFLKKATKSTEKNDVAKLTLGNFLELLLLPLPFTFLEQFDILVIYR